jgi:hypothetical protein
MFFDQATRTMYEVIYTSLQKEGRKEGRKERKKELNRYQDGVQIWSSICSIGI